MSAYIVENKTINNIVSFLHFGSARNICDQFRTNEIVAEIKKIWGYDLTKKSGAQTLGQAFYILNRRAVNDRYNEAEGAKGFNFKDSWDVQPIVAFKAARSLQYQCHEGDIPNENLYRLLEHIINKLAVLIVTETPAYEAAPWG